MSESQPDGREDSPHRAFDLRSRLDDAADPERITVFPHQNDEPFEEWLTIDAEFVVPIDEAV